MRLFLIRHGQTDSNAAGRSQGHADIPLNSTGRAQALAIAAALKGEGIAAIYSSPLQRALQTAAPLAATLGLEIATDRDLIEMDQGDLEGLTGAEMTQKHPDFIKAWLSDDPGAMAIPGGESLSQVQARVRRAIDRIIEIADVDVAVFSHSLALKTYLCVAADVPLKQFRAFTVDPGCYNVVRANGGGLSLEQINCFSPPVD